jgi:hypothetical protein
MTKDFQKGTTGWIIMNNLYGLLTTHIEHAVGLRAFHITKVGRDYAEGFVLDRFGNLPNNGLGHNIITKKKKKKGVEQPFQPHETVAIGLRMRMNDQIFTFEKAKLELIKYIANDFTDESHFSDDESH